MRCGRDIAEVMMLLIPEAWQNDPLMAQVRSRGNSSSSHCMRCTHGGGVHMSFSPEPVRWMEGGREGGSWSNRVHAFVCSHVRQCVHAHMRRSTPPSTLLSNSLCLFNCRPSCLQEKKDFYRFHSAMMEPWDGPALVTFTDGR